jgi:alanine dehydrogenase
MQIIDAESNEAAIQGSDIVVLVTTAKEPFVSEEWIDQGTIVLAMGSFQQTEDAFITSADKIVVDFWEQACHRGELKNLVEQKKITHKDLYAEVGDIVAGATSFSPNAKERILVIPGGLGAHDIYIAHYIFDLARKHNFGLDVDL